MLYSSYTYLWPCRPETAIPSSMLPARERKGWWLQVKKEGSCNVIYRPPRGSDEPLFAMNRHKERQKSWAPSETNSRAFIDLPGDGWYVIETELLHSKVAGVRDINYIHDILVDNGEYLVGKTYAERYDRLVQLFMPDNAPITVDGSAFVIDDHTLLARNHKSNFLQYFREIIPTEETDKNVINEGVVVKDPAAPLAFCLRATSNTSWMMKSRRPTKKSLF